MDAEEWDDLRMRARKPRAVAALVVPLALVTAGSATAGPDGDPACAFDASRCSNELVLQDVVGDANGVNDQGEGLVRDRPTPGRSAPEADLVRVRLSSFSERGRVAGWSVAFRTVGSVGPHRTTGQDLAYAIVSQPTADCRFVVTYTSKGNRPGVATLADSGGCGKGPARVALPARTAGNLLRIDLPYRLLPRVLRPGTVLPGVSAHVRLVPAGTSPLGEIDNAASDGAFRLPATGRAD